jgi:hypothetical protein
MKRIFLIALALISGICSAQTFTVNNLAVNGVSTFANRPTFNGNTPWDSGNLSLPIGVSSGGTGITSLGSGVQTGLGSAVNAGNGFVTYAQNALSGAGITPYAYAAAGNGATDDTTALQNWLNAAASAGQTAYCSKGTYKVTRTLSVTATALRIAGPGGTACAITPSFPAGPTVSGAAAGATYSGAPSIRLTVSTTANIGVAVEVFGVVGTTEANGGWPATVIDGTHVDIVGPTFSHAWSSGGTLALPVIAVNPTTVSAAQPNIDLSGVYFAPPAANASVTDVAIITGPPAGSNAYLHDFVANAYRRGVIFYNSFAPIIKNVFFYNHLGAAIVANQDISFSNARLDHTEFFSNGNTNSEAAAIIGGAFWVEAPTIFNSQFSGNYIGINLAGNVNGASIIGNYLENNGVSDLLCSGSANDGNTITGNWLSANSTQTTSNTACIGTTFSGNWLDNTVWTWGVNSQIPPTNHGTGTGSAGPAGYSLPRVTVSSLPACGAGTIGLLLAVTDANAPVFNGSLTGGGGTSALAYCNGSTWNAH